MTPQEYIGVDPYGNTSKMAKIVISETAFLPLAKISQTGNHILSMWMFSNADRTVTLYYGDKNIELNLTTSWQSYEHKMELAVDDGIYLELPAGTYYIWHAQLERATKKSDWVVAPEDVDASVDAKLEKYATLEITDDKISLVAASTQTYTDNAVDEMGASVDAKLENYATLEVTNNKISTAVTETKTYTDGKADDAVSTAKSYTDQTAKSITSTVEKIEIGGRNYVQNSQQIEFIPNGSDEYDIEIPLYKDILWGNFVNNYTNGYMTLSFDLEASSKLSSDYTSSVWIRTPPWPSFGAFTYPKETTEKKHYVLTARFDKIAYGPNLFIRFMKKDTIKMIMSNVKLEIGNKATDWTPAPEDTEKSITEVKTIAEQTADKFSWLVKSGTSATNFELTDRTANLVANHINLNGLVTFSGLGSDAQKKINTAQSTADTAKSNAATAQSTADGAISNIDALSKSTINTYTIYSSNPGAQWIKLGTLVSAGDSSQTIINVYDGNGYNGGSDQNSQAEIIIKDGWQSSYSANVAFGVSVTRQNCERLLVKVLASSCNTCDIWVYLPWVYVNGMYTVCGQYNSWTDDGVTYQTEEPTTGVAQNVAYRPNAENAQAAADNANDTIADWCYNNDKTYINGGKIYTGSIAAKQINVRDLFAQDITATGTITGATLRSVHIESTSGSIGGFDIDEDSISTSGTDGDSTFYTGLTTKTLNGIAFGALMSYWKMNKGGTWYGGYVQISHGGLEAGRIGGASPIYIPTFSITDQGDVYLPKITSGLEVEGDIILPNEKAIRGTNTSDTIRSNIQPCDRNNNFVLGYGSYSASEGATNIYGKNVSIIANGSITFNPSGTIKAPSRTLTTLWNGALYMGEGHSVSLSDSISNQLNGIVLAWSAYVNNAAQEYWWNYTFIPKEHVSKHYGAAIGVTLTGGHLGYKYVYITSTTITGDADNNKASKVISGVTFEPNYYVLRHVFGV